MGWSLEWLKINYDHFHRLSAIESSEHCIANLKSAVGVEILSNDIDSDWNSTEFDLVIMRHVLEHFMNPVEALRKVAGTLSTNGIVYIAVPDMMNPEGSFKKYWFRVVHTFYFSRTTLQKIALMSNLYPVKIKSENHELWGVFRKATNVEQKETLGNVFYEQMKIIKAHQRKTIMLDAKLDTEAAMGKLLPRGLKTWLKKLHYKLKQ